MGTVIIPDLTNEDMETQTFSLLFKVTQQDSSGPKLMLEWEHLCSCVHMCDLICSHMCACVNARVCVCICYTYV